MAAFWRASCRFVSSKYVAISAAGITAVTSIPSTDKSDLNSSISSHFKHKLGRIFPNFCSTHEPNWSDIQYNKPKIIMDKKDSCCRYIEPKTSPTDEFILNTLHFLHDNIEWRKRDNHHDVAWYVTNGCECDYEYDVGSPQPFNIMPLWMLHFRDAMCVALGIDINDAPNSCNVNWYRDGNAGIGKHADDEDLFEGLEKHIKIISVSIGAEREFEIYQTMLGNEIQGDNAPCVLIKSLVLKNMSYLTMEGMFQKYFKHAVPRYDVNDMDPKKIKHMNSDQKEELVQNIGPRINLTWRWITKHNKHCPLSR